MLKAWQAQPLASEAVHSELLSLIKTRGTVRTKRHGDTIVKISEAEENEFDISDEIVEDIKIRLCFVTNLSRGQQIQV